MNPTISNISTDAAVPMGTSAAQPGSAPEPGRWGGVTDLLSTLIRIDTQIGGPGERAAAEHLAALLTDAGLDPVLLESEPGRANLFVRVPGTDLGLDPLLVQMHLDVVPARPDEWSVHPLSGEVQNGYVWGRGAVDMKNMVATVVTIVLDRLRTRRLPKRPLMLAFFADEENAGPLGAEWAVREHPELFEGVRTAIGEGGGWSVPLPAGQRLYPVHVAEKGWAAMEVTVTGRPAHASRVLDDNPVRVLAEAIGRLTMDRFPVHLSPELEQLLTLVGDLTGIPFDASRPAAGLSVLGTEAANVASSLQHTAHPTRTAAGYQSNVIPGRAWAELDCRYLPGRWEEFLGELHAALGDQVQVRELARTQGLTARSGGSRASLFAAAQGALAAEDETAVVAPYMLAGGTDATHLQSLGIECFGFNPLLLPPDLDFWALFHGIDERVPIESLTFSAQVLDRFFDLY
ncbi:M20/M25/M40 family metallo-hydrolase [Humibacillus sp. DSM 29435]|uniref:M20/M25/M40 family metallo-hydrolase n=1 Tax=Humibacillus sp. DSM 29435 TaxID=1869167 RepID=UPI000A5A3472|nr:M20/M25/M40 family metallo-hydrolase [Humibacillus sp. DSM 29435]